MKRKTIHPPGLPQRGRRSTPRKIIRAGEGARRKPPALVLLLKPKNLIFSLAPSAYPAWGTAGHTAPVLLRGVTGVVSLRLPHAVRRVCDPGQGGESSLRPQPRDSAAGGEPDYAICINVNIIDVLVYQAILSAITLPGLPVVAHGSLPIAAKPQRAIRCNGYTGDVIGGQAHAGIGRDQAFPFSVRKAIEAVVAGGDPDIVFAVLGEFGEIIFRTAEQRLRGKVLPGAIRQATTEAGFVAGPQRAIRGYKQVGDFV